MTLSLPFSRPKAPLSVRIRARERAYKMAVRATAEVVCFVCGTGAVNGAPSYLVKSEEGIYRHGDTAFCAAVIEQRDASSLRRRFFLDLSVWARKRAA